jgi:hypothetical protein
MPTPQEIRSHIKNLRGNLGRDRVFYKRPDGACKKIREAAENLQGQVWRSNSMRVVPEQSFPGHSIGVIPTRGGHGVYAQFSGPPGDYEIIRGTINNVDDPQAVRDQLEELTGVSDWQREF